MRFGGIDIGDAISLAREPESVAIDDAIAPAAAMAKAETRRQRVARRRSFRREECGERSGHGFRARRKALESRQRGDKGHRHHRRQPQVRSDRTPPPSAHRSEEHTSELQSLMRTSNAVICLKKKKNN